MLKQKASLPASFQFDMTCYSPNRRVGLTSDFTNSDLTRFISQLLDDYTTIRFLRVLSNFQCLSFNANSELPLKFQR